MDDHTAAGFKAIYHGANGEIGDGDDIHNLNYHFKVVFNHYPSANELKIIEDITGCKINGQSYYDHAFYFKLPEIIPYDRIVLGESLNGISDNSHK